ncbi:hypothetical protein [Arthrobacter pigmenti]
MDKIASSLVAGSLAPAMSAAMRPRHPLINIIQANPAFLDAMRPRNPLANIIQANPAFLDATRPRNPLANIIQANPAFLDAMRPRLPVPTQAVLDIMRAHVSFPAGQLSLDPPMRFGVSSAV